MANELVSDDERQRQESRRYWDNIAAAFDDAPDHGLRDPVIRDAMTFDESRYRLGYSITPSFHAERGTSREQA